jgi:uncharacterized protein (TIGR03067 family)
MKKTLPAFLTVWFLLAALSSRANQAEAAKKDQDALQGKWTLIAGERDGQAFTPEFMTNSTRTAQGDLTTITIRGQMIMQAKFSVDPSKQPKTVDYAVSAGPYKGATQLGIYDLAGDQVKFCFSVPGQKRPNSFTTKREDGRTLSVWKRDKP